MIEVTVELRLDSFVVNSVVETGDQAAKVPHKALRFVCEKFTARQLVDNTVSADFSFLSTSAQSGSKLESDRESDAQLLKYISTHVTVDISKVIFASGLTGYSTSPKGKGSEEIGRMLLSSAADKNRVMIDLVPKNDEFDALWELVTGQKIQKVIATLICLQLKQDNPAPDAEPSFVAAIVSSSLRMMPGV